MCVSNSFCTTVQESRALRQLCWSCARQTFAIQMNTEGRDYVLLSIIKVYFFIIIIIFIITLKRI